MTCTTATEKPEPDFWGIINRFSSLPTFLRITAWLLRAHDHFRKSASTCSYQVSLSPAELDKALLLWVRLTQQAYFSTEIRNLKTNKPLSKSSSLLRLTPLLDANGSDYVDDSNFLSWSPRENICSFCPAILPAVDNTRNRSLLPANGTQRTAVHVVINLRKILDHRWSRSDSLFHPSLYNLLSPPRYRQITDHGTTSGLTCNAVSTFLQYRSRLRWPAVDKNISRTKRQNTQGLFHYLCLLQHISYTSRSSYRLFDGRIHRCVQTLHRTSGPLLNHHERLRYEPRRRRFRTKKDVQRLVERMDSHREPFHQRWNDLEIPSPSAPHFGGKWEAGVKSVKFHLRRMIGNALLTYEELTTFLVQIEAILNSRPFAALSDDPSDASALTLGHFLVGSALTTVPEPCLQEIPQNRLSRLQLLRQMIDSFWRRWSSEYLHQFQTFSKWYRKQKSVQKGNLVLIKDERFPPTKWPLARIIDVHPGADGMIRVVTVKTATSTFKRPIAKLCVLPNSSET